MVEGLGVLCYAMLCRKSSHAAKISSYRETGAKTERGVEVTSPCQNRANRSCSRNRREFTGRCAGRPAPPAVAPLCGCPLLCAPGRERSTNNEQNLTRRYLDGIGAPLGIFFARRQRHCLASCSCTMYSQSPAHGLKPLHTRRPPPRFWLLARDQAPAVSQEYRMLYRLHGEREIPRLGRANLFLIPGERWLG